MDIGPVLEGKNVFVSGAGTLGSPIARAAAKAGARRVIISRRNAEEAKATAKELSKETGFLFDSIAADVSSDDSVRRAVDTLVEALNGDPLHAVVVTPGGNKKDANQGLREAPLSDPRPHSPEERMEYVRRQLRANRDIRALVYRTNAVGPIEFLDEIALRILLPQEAASSVVFIGSVAPRANLSGVQAYAAAKSALETEANFRAAHFGDMRYELGLRDAPVRVNTVVWGFTDSPQNRGMLVNEDETLTHRGHRIIDRTPLRRFGLPEEITPQVMLLLSDLSGYTNGTSIVIDGGFSTQGGV